MFAFIFQLLMMISLGTLVYLIAQTLPRIDDTPQKELRVQEHWVMAYIERIDSRLKTVLEKILRKLNVTLLKLQNKVNQRVMKLKHENSSNGSDILKVDQKEDSNQE